MDILNRMSGIGEEQRLSPALDALASRFRAGDPVFGTPLSSITRGWLHLPQTVDSLSGVDKAGTVWHVVAVPSITRRIARTLGTEVIRRGETGTEEEGGAPGGDAHEEEGFRFVAVSAPDLDPDKAWGEHRVVLVVDETPDERGWKALLVAVGPLLAGVYTLADGSLNVAPLPAALAMSSPQVEGRPS